jgi:hypothetical protein
MQIERLRRYKTSDDGYHWYSVPTEDDVINKINEIIDYINSVDASCFEELKKKLRENE